MKSEVYRRKVDTQAKLLNHIMYVIACIKDCQDADKQHDMFSHELQSAVMLMCEILKNIWLTVPILSPEQ
jgi:hypothetical protein